MRRDQVTSGMVAINVQIAEEVHKKMLHIEGRNKSEVVRMALDLILALYESFKNGNIIKIVHSNNGNIVKEEEIRF